MIGGILSTLQNLQGGFCPPCQKLQGVLCPPCKKHEGCFVHLCQNEQGGFCPGGVLSGYLQYWVVLLIWIVVEQGPAVLAVGVGGGYLDSFSLPVRMYRKSYCTTHSVSFGGRHLG